MTIRPSITTQRIALLRLLAGWEIVLAVLACPVFAERFTQPVRGLLSSLLFKAELAAGYLVIAAARGLIKRGAVRADHFDPRAQADALAGTLAALLSHAASDADDAITVDRLRRRITALKRVLRTLPRCALRLLRTLSGTRSTDESSLSPLSLPHLTVPRALRRAVRIDRPPDKNGEFRLCTL